MNVLMTRRCLVEVGLVRQCWTEIPEGTGFCEGQGGLLQGAELHR